MAEDSAYVTYTQARAALMRGDRAEAIELLRASAHAEPHFKTLELLGEALIDQGAQTDGIVYLAAAVGLAANQSRPRFLRAKALAASGHLQDAVRLLDEALSLNPQYESARELRSQIVSSGERGAFR
jgi:tetratricopeptide (TPR) repeat protein